MTVDDEIAWYTTQRADVERDYLRGVRIPEGFTVKLTCESCPEQWDIFYDFKPIGYLRCRSSRWSLDYPDCGGDVLIGEPWHPERGRYESNFDDERPAIFDRVFRALVERKLNG